MWGFVSGDFMDNKLKKSILNVLKIAVSLALCAVAVFSMLGATLINVGRDYLNSDEFAQMVETADLHTVKFSVKDKKVNVAEYLVDVAKEYVKTKNPYFFSFVTNAIESLFPWDSIEKVVKTEVMYLVDFVVNSDSKQAKERLDNGKSVEEVLELNPKNATSPEEALRIFIRSFIIKSIENTAKMSTDKFIVFLSEATVTKLVLISVASLLALAIINLRTVFNVFLYSGLSSFACGFIIKYAQSKFVKMNAGAQDLIGYTFLKPLADMYSKNAVMGFVFGTVLVCLFFISCYLFKKCMNKPEEMTEK